MSAKLIEFQRALENELRAAASMGISLCLELCNVGDNDFEHVAFQEVVKRTSCVSLAKNIRCSQGKTQVTGQVNHPVPFRFAPQRLRAAVEAND